MSAIHLCTVIFCALTLQRVSHQIFIYWELDDAGFRERRFFNLRSIAWKDVTHVGYFEVRKRRPSSIAILYARKELLADSGCVVALPEDREQFIAALRRFATQAKFEL